MSGVIISLCDLTGAMAAPWVEAGYRAVLVDPQHPAGINTEGRITRIGCVITEAAGYLGHVLRTERIVFAFGFPPCTDVAVSGSLHFAKKALADRHFQAKAALVAEQCRMIGMLSGAPWGFENPVSVFSSIFGRAQHSFHPWHFNRLCVTDNYTKNTQLWTGGGFVMPGMQVRQETADAISIVKQECGRMVAKPKALEATGNDPLVLEWYPDDRIHKAPPGPERANFRSATQRGFARAVFEANQPCARIGLVNDLFEEVA